MSLELLGGILALISAVAFMFGEHHHDLYALLVRWLPDRGNCLRMANDDEIWDYIPLRGSSPCSFGLPVRDGHGADLSVRYGSSLWFTVGIDILFM